jgi:hypothetical protein
MIGDGGRIELGKDFTGHQRARQTIWDLDKAFRETT